MVGVKDGRAEGVPTGACDGKGVGAPDGRGVGSGVGWGVEGEFEGCGVEGALEGTEEGSSEGDMEGGGDGELEGAAEGRGEGRNEGGNVGTGENVSLSFRAAVSWRYARSNGSKQYFMLILLTVSFLMVTSIPSTQRFASKCCLFESR